MEMVELHAKLLQEQGLPALIALASGKDAISKGEACRALANLAANTEVQQQILKEGGLQPLASSIMTDDPICERFAALAIANLSTTVSNQVKIVQIGAVGPLIKLAQGYDKELEARRYATLAIANLAATIANHPTIIEEDGGKSSWLLAYISITSLAPPIYIEA